MITVLILIYLFLPAFSLTENTSVPHVKEYDEIPFIDRDMLLKISYYRKNKRNNPTYPVPATAIV